MKINDFFIYFAKKFSLVGNIYAWFRRRFLLKYRTNYIENKLKLRKGNCLKCGECCNTFGTIFNTRCIFLSENNLCNIYKDRFITCKSFPIDEVELKLTGMNNCGFYW